MNLSSKHIKMLLNNFFIIVQAHCLALKHLACSLDANKTLSFTSCLLVS